MKNLYIYKTVIKCDDDYYTDRGLVQADSLEEGVQKMNQYFQGTSEKIVTIELDEVEDIDSIFQDGHFSIYSFLADISMSTDITHELKEWCLIKD